MDIKDFSALGAPEQSAPAAANLISGQPRQQIWNVLSSGDRRFHVGQWASSPGAWRVNYTEYELCHLLEGVVRLTDAAGAARTYRAGDTFVIPSGFRGSWEVVEACRKIYAIYE
ncbi:MAG: cupin domain-containing protein [Proteobacteria bacterium]|nr:cupin domain-containing protein [Pseudomonadota bacterium]